jgi:hypothetical protein
MFRNDPDFEDVFLKGENNPHSLAKSVALQLLSLTAEEAKVRERRSDHPPERMKQLREV